MIRTRDRWMEEFLGSPSDAMAYPDLAPAIPDPDPRAPGAPACGCAHCEDFEEFEVCHGPINCHQPEMCLRRGCLCVSP